MPPTKKKQPKPRGRDPPAPHRRSFEIRQNVRDDVSVELTANTVYEEPRRKSITLPHLDEHEPLTTMAMMMMSAAESMASNSSLFHDSDPSLMNTSGRSANTTTGSVISNDTETTNVVSNKSPPKKQITTTTVAANHAEKNGQEADPKTAKSTEQNEKSNQVDMAAVEAAGDSNNNPRTEQERDEVANNQTSPRSQEDRGLGNPANHPTTTTNEDNNKQTDTFEEGNRGPAQHAAASSDITGLPSLPPTASTNTASAREVVSKENEDDHGQEEVSSSKEPNCSGDNDRDNNHPSGSVESHHHQNGSDQEQNATQEREQNLPEAPSSQRDNALGAPTVATAAAVGGGGGEAAESNSQEQQRMSSMERQVDDNHQHQQTESKSNIGNDHASEQGAQKEAIPDSDDNAIGALAPDVVAPAETNNGRVMEDHSGNNRRTIDVDIDVDEIAAAVELDVDDWGAVLLLDANNQNEMNHPPLLSSSHGRIPIDT